MKLYWIAAAAGLTCAACATTQGETQLASNADVRKVTPEGEELICEYEKVLGSLRRIEVCKTRAEIEAENASAGIQDTNIMGSGTQGSLSRDDGKRF